MTVQPELDFALGLTPGIPTEGPGRNFNLEVSPSVCLNTQGKLRDIPERVYAQNAGTKTAVGRTKRVAFVVSIYEGKPFDVATDLASRRTYFVDGDERYATMRTGLANLARVAVANGIAKMPEGYTLDDLNKLKGFRWSPNAGCSMCPCSPAFMSPLLVSRDYDVNWVEGVFTLRENESVTTVVDKSVLRANLV